MLKDQISGPGGKVDTKVLDLSNGKNGVALN